MYLKSIEAHGFKAFANKIKLEFNEGITGIVGPNGSGKSNIADAVRWVLGEQSAKQLRGSSMQDVIFSGTENRKPLGFAYVTLTLDNSDHWLPISYDEVTVGRRVYRSGESEYLINGSVCRLRDVQELFFDTGIGKEGYSLIGQGQIDKIVSSKPEERRELFDEAAGIVKYKRRKSAAQKNLETEKLNLSRVNDILAEIEKQIGPLEKQYEKAKQYLKLRDELREQEIAVFAAEFDANNAKLGELENKLAIINKDLENARLEYEGSKQEYELLLEELEKRQELLEKTKEEKNAAVLEKQNAENDIKLFSEQILTIKAGDEHYRLRKKSLESRRSGYQDSYDMLTTSLKNAEKDFESVKAMCDKTQAELDEKKAEVTRLLQEETALANRRMAALAESAEVKAELERINAMGEQYNIRRAEINSRLLTLKSEQAINERQMQEAKEELKEASDKVIKKATECDELEKTIAELGDDIHNSQDEAGRKKQHMLITESKIDTLKNLSERYEGYGSAVRNVMDSFKGNPGICGVVADLITADKKHENAIETALGGNVQNIIVKYQDTARECIDYLKENRLGRATFIPLDIVKPRNENFDDGMTGEKGIIGIASDIVNYDKEHEGAVKYLLGRYLVADDYDHALAVFKKYGRRHFIVTLNGELFAPGGAVSGGAFKNNSNLLGRKRELEELEELYGKLKNETEKLEAEVAAKRKDREEKRRLLESAKTELSALYVDQNTAKLNLNHANEQTQNYINGKAALDKELSELDGEYADIKLKLEELNSKLGADSESRNEEQKEADRLAALIAAAREEEEKANAANVEKLTIASTAELGIQHIRDNIGRVEIELHGVKWEEEELEESRKNSELELEEKNASIEATKQKIDEITELIAKKDEIITELSGANDAINNRNKEFFDKSRQLSENIANLDKEEFRLRSARDRLVETIDGNTRYMWEEYELTVTTAKAVVLSIDPSTVTRKSINELKGRIRALGDVNVGAIEEFKAVSERYTFLKTQRDDIVKAQNALEDIIEELDVDMKKQFLATFEEVNKRFDSVFKELFGGGAGRLELVEDEDVLSAGVRIIAQPPGKKLQNMMQLSGGEKALTAISLLFAILDLKPSPFCLLDEIEAALDDSNVSRFANYLKKLTDSTQFIVITHRRGTMAAADSLYGITMQEKGVSALVSVNLVESELSN